LNLSIERLSFGRSLTIASLLALAAGIAVGTFVPIEDHAALQTLGALVEMLGKAWVRCLRMIILPLVVSLLVVAILGSRESLRVARAGGAAVGIFFAVYAALAVLSFLLFPPLIRAFGIRPGSMAGLDSVETAPSEAPAGLDIADWLLQVVPTNPFSAAAEENVLQVVVFTIVFAVAVGRLPIASRNAVLSFFAPVAEAMLVVISWLMRVSPVAIFALALAAAREVGIGAAWGLVAFAIIATIVMVVAILGLSCMAGLLGGVGVARFFRAAWPGQLVALATRSSLASVPALIDGARNRLGLSDRVVGFGIPFAASTFKPNRLISSPGKLLFLSWVYAVPIDPMGYLIFLGYVMLLAATTVGIPNQHARHVSLPAYLALGIPVEGVVLIGSVDMLWDFAATALNSTGYLAATSLLPRAAAAPHLEPSPEPLPS
jgi:proton glutamate symport protein